MLLGWGIGQRICCSFEGRGAGFGACGRSMLRRAGGAECEIVEVAEGRWRADVMELRHLRFLQVLVVDLRDVIVMNGREMKVQ